jgi:PhzF family phenazine biosynthesis protein
VPDAAGLSDAQMAAVAAELAASETAFLTDSSEADRRVRYFTPTREVDLCGHATVASHAHLYADGALGAGEHSLETNAGVLTIRVTDDGVVWMTQAAPSVRPVEVDYDRLGGALGIDPAALRDVGAELPAATASTGPPWLLVPVNYLQRLGDPHPDPAAVEAVADGAGAVGIYPFTFDTLSTEATLHARAFAPGAGVPEDPVTGTAAGCCGAYLREFDAFDGDFPDEIRIEQGQFLDRGGLVRVTVGPDDGIRVGGRAATALDGTITVPERGEELIEA